MPLTNVWIAKCEAVGSDCNADATTAALLWRRCWASGSLLLASGTIALLFSSSIYCGFAKSRKQVASRGQFRRLGRSQSYSLLVRHRNWHRHCVSIQRRNSLKQPVESETALLWWPCGLVGDRSVYRLCEKTMQMTNLPK